jgi:hypothetical protein
VKEKRRSRAGSVTCSLVLGNPNLGLMAVSLVLAIDKFIDSSAFLHTTLDFKNVGLIGWYTTSAYFITQMSFQPAFGQLYTVFPIKIVNLVLILIFGIGSNICAVAPAS